MKRIIGPILTIILVIGVGAAIFFSARQQFQARQRVTVRGLIGSEKEDFFLDPRVIEALAKHNLIVQVEKAGSRQISTHENLPNVDFAFPAGVPAAEKLRREQSGTQAYDVFFTPMAIASWRPIAEILKAEGIAEERDGAYYIINMTKLIEASVEHKRWKEFPAAQANGYDVDKTVLISSTDVRTSNSAAMYLALVSYVLNDGNIAQATDIDRLMPQLAPLFLGQGFQASSSQTPFEDYRIMGIGRAPLVMIYEAQFLYQATQPDGLRPEMVLMYPEPTVFTKHVLVSLNEKGEQLGEVLTTDPALQRLAIEHGFRNNNIDDFQEFIQARQLKIPTTLVNVIDPPSYEVIEAMIQRIEAQYN